MLVYQPPKITFNSFQNPNFWNENKLLPRLGKLFTKLKQVEMIWNHMTAYLVPLTFAKLSKFPQILYSPLHKGRCLLGKLAAAASSESHDTAHPRPSTGLTTFLLSANLDRVRKHEILEKSEFYNIVRQITLSCPIVDEKYKRTKQLQWVIINYYLPYLFCKLFRLFSPLWNNRSGSRPCDSTSEV